MIMRKVEKILRRFCLLFYGISLVFAGCSWLGNEDERVIYSSAALGGNRIVLEIFYKDHARLPYSLDELKLYCEKQEIEFLHYHKSYDDAISGNTVSFMGFFPETNVRYGAFVSNFVEFRTPLIYDFTSANYLHDRDWIIASFYMPSVMKQAAITFDASKENPFVLRKFPTNEFKRMLKKQNLAIPHRKTTKIKIINIIVFLLPAVAWVCSKSRCRKPGNEDDIQGS